MRALFERNVKVLEFRLFAELEVETERKDIQAFLESYETKGTEVSRKVQRYLTTIGLFDKDGNLTKKGKQVLEQGKMFIPEMGLYRIWLIEPDDLIDMRIVGVQRERPSKMNEEIQPQEYDYPNPDGKPAEEAILLFRQQKKEDLEQRLTRIKVRNFGKGEYLYGSLERSGRTVRMKWVWDETGKQKIVLEGTVRAASGNLPLFQLKNRSPFQGKLPGLVEKLLLGSENQHLSWDPAKQKLRIPFSRNHSNELMEKFQGNFPMDTSDFEYGVFEKAELQEVPVMPSTIEDAKKWRNYLVRSDLKGKYFTPPQFKHQQDQLASREEFSSFGLQAESPQGYLKNNFSGPANDEAFWHLAAPMDLNPFDQPDQTEEVLHWIPGQEVTLGEIADKLRQGKNIKEVIVVDRYVNKAIQQKSLHVLVKELLPSGSGVSSLMTVFGGDRASYLKDQAPEITQVDFGALFKTLDHDRFWILRSDQEETIWTATRSLGFLNFGEHEPEADTEAVVKEGAVTFLKVKKGYEIFSPSLKEELERIGGKA